MKHKGFTLIEILMVAAILSLLLSFVFFNVSEAKKKGEDAHMKAESGEIAKAVYQYKDDNQGRVPGALTVTRGVAHQEGSAAYQTAMQELVNSGYLAEIPSSPSGSGYAYVISLDGEEAVFAADLNYEYEESTSNSCPLTEDDDEGGGGTDEDPCPEPEYPPEFSDVYGLSFDYVSGNNYPYPKLQVPYMNGTCDIAHNYDYGFSQLAGILEYGEYDCIELPSGLSQAQAICDAYVPVSGNQCSGLSGPYYNGVNGVFIYHAFELSQINEYVQDHLNTFDEAYAEYDACLIEHADEYDDDGYWIGGGDDDDDEESESICDGLSDSDYCTCI